MRTFNELKTELKLLGPKKWKDFAGDRYRVHLGEARSTAKLREVRHFPPPFAHEHVMGFVQILKQASDWVETAGLTDILYVEQPAEIGLDFVATPNIGHPLFRSTFELDLGDEMMDRKEAYLARLPAVREKWNKLPDTGRSAILKRVIRRSVLEVSGKTYIESEQYKIVVYETVIDDQDVFMWVDTHL